jgi:hypothetical protein
MRALPPLDLQTPFSQGKIAQLPSAANFLINANPWLLIHNISKARQTITG